MEWSLKCGQHLKPYSRWPRSKLWRTDLSKEWARYERKIEVEEDFPWEVAFDLTMAEGVNAWLWVAHVYIILLLKDANCDKDASTLSNHSNNNAFSFLC